MQVERIRIPYFSDARKVEEDSSEKLFVVRESDADSKRQRQHYQDPSQNQNHKPATQQAPSDQQVDIQGTRIDLFV